MSVEKTARFAYQVRLALDDYDADAPLLVDCAALNAETTIALCALAARHGADYALVCSPPHLDPVDYVTAVADCSPIPLVLYDSQDTSFAATEVVELATNANIDACIFSVARGPGRGVGFCSACKFAEGPGCVGKSGREILQAIV